MTLHAIRPGAGGLPLLAGLALLLAANEAAQARAPAAEERLEAQLLFRAGSAETVLVAPTLASDVAIEVNGQIARVTVRQRFANPSSAWLEGIYVFPLPERSAVDRLVLTIGERRVEGRILEREEARRLYERAAGEGRRAALLSGERPNVFVTSVANVGPGEEVAVEIEYQDRVSYSDGRFQLRFPMVVAPRYTPAGPAGPAVRGPAAPQPDGPTAQPVAAGTETAPPREARDLFGPVRRPSAGPANPVSLAVALDAGLELESVESLYHPVTVTGEARRRLITLAGGPVPAARDFVLEWRPRRSAEAEAALFAEQVGPDTYLLLSILPPDQGEDAAVPRLPRDLVLVVDTSGSMHGQSIEQAKLALLVALDGLRPEDRFNIIRFDDAARALFPAVQPARDEALRRAGAFVGGLAAEGGTHIAAALDLALAEPADPGRLRQVVFLTDGAVGNEQELFARIAARLGATRLFTVGIGSAPNSYFMRKAAELGRGSFTHIGDLGEVARRMGELLAKLEQPRVTDLAVAWPGWAAPLVEAYPSRIRDLYAGEPIELVARLEGTGLEALRDRLSVTGRRGGQPWMRSLSLDGLRSAHGIAAVWARAKVDALLDGLAFGRDPGEVRRDVVRVALAHRLVTRYTSLVAVDEQAARPSAERLETGEVARNLPDGWDFEKVFGPEGPGMELRPAPAILRQAALQGEPVGLPATATPAALHLLAGLAALVMGTLLLLGARLARGSLRVAR